MSFLAFAFHLGIVFDLAVLCSQSICIKSDVYFNDNISCPIGFSIYPSSEDKKILILVLVDFVDAYGDMPTSPHRFLVAHYVGIVRGMHFVKPLNSTFAKQCNLKIFNSVYSSAKRCFAMNCPCDCLRHNAAFREHFMQ